MQYIDLSPLPSTPTSNPQQMSEPEAPTLLSSVADVWGLKEIQYGPPGEKKTYKVITQNFNGFVHVPLIGVFDGRVAGSNLYYLPLVDRARL